MPAGLPDASCAARGVTLDEIHRPPAGREPRRASGARETGADHRDMASA